MSINQSGWRPEMGEGGTAATATHTGNRALMLEEPLIFEIGSNETTGMDFTQSPSPRLRGEGRGEGMQPTGGELLRRAKAMRRDMTPAEARLWYLLRARRFGDVKVSRQVVIGSYIVDFCARARKLVIEVDGNTHGGNEAADERRTAALQARGYRVIRFSNADVMTNEAAVLSAISAALAAAPLPGPLPIGEREAGA